MESYESQNGELVVRPLSNPGDKGLAPFGSLKQRANRDPVTCAETSRLFHFHALPFFPPPCVALCRCSHVDSPHDLLMWENFIVMKTIRNLKMICPDL